tara:strand:- start:271 stop:492 length:222 start_codon:yes stop_codon:yes gene_type:complete
VKKKETKSKKKKNHIDANGKRIRFLSPDSSIYKNDSTIILFGRRHSQPNNDPKSKFEEFISRAPISFDNGEEE